MTATSTDSLTTLSTPSLAEAHELLAPALQPHDDRLITIAGRCTVEYDGRAASTLGPGDRFVLIKPDGSVLVHTTEQRTPVNWQPPGCTHESTLESIEDGTNSNAEAESALWVRSLRTNPHELLEIRFTDVFQLSVLALTDKNDLELQGSEEDLRQRILTNPSLIEEGFEPQAVERETAAGPVDIFGVDAQQTPTVVELKRRRVGPDAVGQLKRYVDAVEQELSDERSARGILVAPSLTNRAHQLVDAEHLEYLSVDPPQKTGGAVSQLSDYTTEGSS